MNMQVIARNCQWETLLDVPDHDDIASAYTSDLLSDVMANAQDAGLLITIQAHNNAVAVASLAGMKGIVICNDRTVPEDMLASAAKEQIAVFRTKANQFETSCAVGKLLTA